jgi:hypothetical protein
MSEIYRVIHPSFTITITSKMIVHKLYTLMRSTRSAVPHPTAKVASSAATDVSHTIRRIPHGLDCNYPAWWGGRGAGCHSICGTPSSSPCHTQSNPTKRLLLSDYTEYSLNVRWRITACSLNTHWMFAECSLNVHSPVRKGYTVEGIHWMLTECSLNVLWMFTALLGKARR